MMPLAQAVPEIVREQHFELLRWTVGIGIIVGVGLSIAGVWLIFWLYRNEKRGTLNATTRAVLIGLRCAVLMLLGFIALEPVLTPYLQKTVRATTLVLLDDSGSMAIRDQYRNDEDRLRISALTSQVADGVRRGDLLEAILQRDNGALLAGLAEDNDVQLLRFSDGLRHSLGNADSTSTGNTSDATPLANPNGDESVLSLKFDGQSTDIARSIHEAVRSLSGAPVAGIVLLSDGGMNQGESADALARYLEESEIPLFAVGIGDPAPPINVRVTEITAPRNAFSRDPFDITVQIAADGIETNSLQVELVRRGGADGEDRVVDRRTASRNGDGSFDPLQFEQKIDEPGSVVFAARIQPVPFEAVETDNVRETSPPIQVLDNRMRVLIVAGAPTYEYRYLSRLLERDETVDVSCWLQSADPKAVRDGDIVIDHLPSTNEELSEYDVFILLDTDPRGLDPEWSARVATLVDNVGAGLLYQADTKFASFFVRDAVTRPIATILPVVYDSEAELILNRIGRYQLRYWPLMLTAEAAGSPLLRQADDVALNAEIWSLLDGVYWHYPVKREKPAASVLLRHGNPQMAGATGPHVLYATQFVGAGRTAFLGFNTTWRWQRYGVEFHERFWIPAIRYLMEGKLLGGKQRGSITTEQDQYVVGDTIVVTIRAMDERFEPLTLDRLELRVMRPGEIDERRTALAIPGRDGFYQARFVAQGVGPLQLTTTVPTRAGEPAVVRSDIYVNQADLELVNAVLRRDLLKTLATRSGGAYLDVNEAAKLPDLIDNRSEVFPPIAERPKPLWDNGWVFLVIIALLTLEWIGRKRARLL